MQPYVILTGGWIAYFAVHSLLASSYIKQRYNFAGYRIVYVALAGAGLLALLLYNGRIEAPYFFESEGLPRYASFALTIAGVMIIQSSFRQYSFRGFVGMKAEESVLKTDGILGVVRHPIYSGIILITLALFLFIPNLPTLVSCVCMLAYIPIGIVLEEKKLVAAFGTAYLEYKSKVPAVVPRLR